MTEEELALLFQQLVELCEELRGELTELRARPLLKGDPGQPGEDGKAPTLDDLQLMVDAWLLAHFIQPVLPPIVPVSTIDIETAVNRWLTERVETLRGEPGQPGTPGEPGKPGQPGDPGLAPSDEQVTAAVAKFATEWFTQNFDSLRGAPGPVGSPPEHEWRGALLRFKNPDGTWGAWTDLRGPSGSGAGGGVSVSGVQIPGPPGPPGPPGSGLFYETTLSGLSQTIHQSQHGMDHPVATSVRKPDGSEVSVVVKFVGADIIIDSNVLLDGHTVFILGA